MKNSDSCPNIPTRIIKKCASLVSIHISNILNACIELGYFPTMFKIAKVIPIFKAKDPLISSNYRPISLLPVFAKVFEKHIYNQSWARSGKNRIFKIQIQIRKISDL